MKAVVLCRVSSKEQEQTGYSLPAQEKLLKSYRDKRGFLQAQDFTIAETASGRKQREIFSTMMGYIKKNNIKMLIVEKVDRLTRNFKDAVMIDEWLEEDEEREVHFVKDSLVLHKNSRSQEKLNWGIRILFAKNYIDNLSEEVKKGQKEKLAQGWLPTRPPVGYKTVGEKGHKIHVLDDTRVPLVKKMFELYAAGNHSLQRLTKIMNDAGLRNEQGNKIVKSRMHQYLTDPFYIGKNRWNDQLYNGHQETFISKELFEKVQKILNSRSTPMYQKHNFLLRAMMRCFECSGLITWETHKDIIYGHCNHYRNCSQRKWFTQGDIENQLVKSFERLQIRSPRLVEWIRKALKESHRDIIEFYTTSLDELNARFVLIEKRFEKIYDDKVDGKITEEFYNKKLKQYSDEKDKVTEAIQKHTNASTKFYQLAINIYEISQRAKEIYLKAKDLDKKRSLLKLIFQQLTVDSGKVYFVYTKAFKLLIEAVNKTNSTKMDKIIKIERKIFELDKQIDISSQIDGFYAYRPILLLREDSNLRPIA